jgi:hypothetical protein
MADTNPATPIKALQPNQSDTFPFGEDTDPRHRFAILMPNNQIEAEALI